MPPAATLTPARLAICTKSSSSFGLARKWLEDCAGKHATCRRHTQHDWDAASHGIPPRFVPSRLVDVSDETPRIFCTADDNIVPERYLALSHCWGGKDIVRLLTTNIELMTQGIEVASLSQTFRDALYITRTLGYRYIWIDTLASAGEGD